MTSRSGLSCAEPDRRALPPELRRMEVALGFQRRSWTVERAGWAGMALLILAGLLGLLGGSGWLLEAAAATPDGGLRLRYDRTQRLGSPTNFQLELRAPPERGQAELRLHPGFVGHWRIESIVPAPETASAGPDGLRLAFRIAPGAAVLPVVLRGQPAGGFGLVRAVLTAGEGPVLPVAVLVWP